MVFDAGFDSGDHIVQLRLHSDRSAGNWHRNQIGPNAHALQSEFSVMSYPYDCVVRQSEPFANVLDIGFVDQVLSEDYDRVWF